MFFVGDNKIELSYFAAVLLYIPGPLARVLAHFQPQALPC